MLARTCLIAAALLALLTASTLAADPVPEYFNLPTGYNASSGIAPAPDGSVWFAASPPAGDVGAVGRLTTAQAAANTTNGMAIFPTPADAFTGCCVRITRSVAFDAEHSRIWFVQSNGVVGWGNPALMQAGSSNGMQAIQLPGMQALYDIAIGAQGLAWFTEESASNVGPTYYGDRIASVGEGLAVTELDNIALQHGRTSLDSLRYDAQPKGIATDAHGIPWFAESSSGNPGYRIATPDASDYSEYLLQPCVSVSPCSGSFTDTGPSDVAVAQDGSVWFTNELLNQVGRLDVVNHTFTNYSLPAIDAGLASGKPVAISAAPDGSLWVGEYGGYSAANANAIVEIVPNADATKAPTATVYHLGAGKFPLAVAPDTKGNVWFALATTAAPGQIGRLAGVVTVSGGGGGGDGGGKPITATSVGRAQVGATTTSGSSATVDQICVGPPQDRCSLVFIISAHEYVTGFPNTKASAAAAKAGRKKHRKPAPVILGTKTVTLKGGQHKHITVTLNATGKRLLAHAPNGRLKVFFTVTQKGAKGKAPKRVKALKLTFKRPKPHRRR